MSFIENYVGITTIRHKIKETNNYIYSSGLCLHLQQTKLPLALLFPTIYYNVYATFLNTNKYPILYIQNQYYQAYKMLGLNLNMPIFSTFIFNLLDMSIFIGGFCISYDYQNRIFGFYKNTEINYSVYGGCKIGIHYKFINFKIGIGIIQPIIKTQQKYIVQYNKLSFIMLSEIYI